MERNKPPIIEKPAMVSSPSLSEQLSSLLSQQEQTRQKEIWRDEVEIKVKTRGLPFMLLPLSDLHIGSQGVDYQALKEYLDFLRDYPVYAVLVGDLADNFSPTAHADGMMRDLQTPTEQWITARAFFKEYEKKILAVVSGGQHDFWQEDNSGIDIYQFITQELNIPLLQAGGLLRLKVDEQDYRIRLYHKIARLNSQFNFTHAGKQALRLLGDEADVIISGDKHLGAVEQTHIGKKRTIIQLGTFKTDDEWGRRQGLVQQPRPFYPVLLFFQGQHNVEIIENLGQAKEMIDMMKRYYRQLAVSVLGLNEKR